MMLRLLTLFLLSGLLTATVQAQDVSTGWPKNWPSPAPSHPGQNGIEEYSAMESDSTEVDSVEENKPERILNIRTNPLSLLLGFYGADLDLGLTPQLTLGPSVSYFSGELLKVRFKLPKLGVRANYYTAGERFKDSFIIGPYAYYSPLSFTRAIDGVAYEANLGAVIIGSSFAYQWALDSGFNLTLGAGLGIVGVSSSARGTAADGAQREISLPSFGFVLPMLESSLGWAF
jgi:hypothetical protein